MLRASASAVLVTLALGRGAAAQPPPDPQNPRSELEALAVELEAGVRKVSQPSVEPILASEPARGYYVPGAGAMFVVPSRSVPRETRLLVLRRQAGPQAGLPPVTSDPEYNELVEVLGPEGARAEIERRQLEQQARTEIARSARQRRLSSSDREEQMRRLEKQVEAIQREAALANQEFEREWEEMTFKFQQRLEGNPAGGSSGTVVKGGGQPPPGRLPAPPWTTVWFATSDPEDTRSAPQIVAQVKDAIVSVLEARGGELRNVAPQEQVVVAVDFLPRSLFGGSQRPVHTLVVRVRKQLLEERLANRLPSDQLRAKIEFNEY